MSDLFAQLLSGRTSTERAMPDQNETREHVIRFVKQKHAEEFVLDTYRWSQELANVVRKGKTVTLRAPKWTTDGQLFALDLAEFVGYHGSPPEGPVATLDGNRTPRSY